MGSMEADAQPFAVVVVRCPGQVDHIDSPAAGRAVAIGHGDMMPQVSRWALRISRPCAGGGRRSCLQPSYMNSPSCWIRDASLWSRELSKSCASFRLSAAASRSPAEAITGRSVLAAWMSSSAESSRPRSSLAAYRSSSAVSSVWRNERLASAESGLCPRCG